LKVIESIDSGVNAACCKAQRSEPTPESALVVTTKLAACAGCQAAPSKPAVMVKAIVRINGLIGLVLVGFYRGGRKFRDQPDMLRRK
jgi:hypothetical protein